MGDLVAPVTKGGGLSDLRLPPVAEDEVDAVLRSAREGVPLETAQDPVKKAQ